MLYKLQNDGKNIAVSACYYRFSFFPVCSVKDIVATKSTVFQHLVFLACSGSLFPCDSDSLWLTLDLFLTLSGALWLKRFLLGSLRRSCIAPVYLALLRRIPARLETIGADG